MVWETRLYDRSLRATQNEYLSKFRLNSKAMVFALGIKESSKWFDAQIFWQSEFNKSSYFLNAIRLHF